MLSESEIAEIIDRVKGRVQAAEGRTRTGPSLAAADSPDLRAIRDTVIVHRHGFPGAEDSDGIPIRLPWQVCNRQDSDDTLPVTNR